MKKIFDFDYRNNGLNSLKRSFGVILSQSWVIYVILSTIHIRDIWESSFTCICSSLSFHSTESSVTWTWKWTEFICTGSVSITWWVITLVDIGTWESITVKSNVTFAAEITIFVNACCIIVTRTNLWVILMSEIIQSVLWRMYKCKINPILWHIHWHQYTWIRYLDIQSYIHMRKNLLS